MPKYTFLPGFKPQISSSCDLNLKLYINLTNLDNIFINCVYCAQCGTRPSYFYVLQYVEVSSGLDYNFFSYRVHKHTHRPTHTQLDIQTDMSTL